MLKTAWIEIPVKDMTRAKAFYEKVFSVSISLHEMKPIQMGWFSPMEEEAYGTTGALVQGEGYVPSLTGTRIYFSVEDIEDILKKAGKNGGRIILPKMGIGEYGFIGHFEDSEGNLIGLHAMA